MNLTRPEIEQRINAIQNEKDQINDTLKNKGFLTSPDQRRVYYKRRRKLNDQIKYWKAKLSLTQ